MQKSYRWGIMGAGRIAEKFCTALEFVEGSQVYAVASRDGEKAKSYAEKFNAAVYYDNYDDLVNDNNVDIIYIATPHAFHHEQALVCLHNKKPVLCEKPMSLSARKTREMIDAAAENNVFLMEGMWMACMPFIEKIRTIIKNGLIGELRYIAADFGFSALVDNEGRLYKKELGGGAQMDVGVYPLFLATLFLGEPSVVKTIARLSATGVDEYTNIILQYPGGATAHLISSISFNTAVEAELIGTRGRIKIDNPWFKATGVSLHLEDGTEQDFSIPHLSNGFEHEIKEVMYCLDNGLLQSSKVPHDLSLLVSKITAEVLQQAGVAYE